VIEVPCAVLANLVNAEPDWRVARLNTSSGSGPECPIYVT